jgi:hypothetical protein
MRLILLTLLLISLLPTTSKAQKLEFNGDFLLFREAKTKQPVLVINDSLVYKGNDMKRIAFKHTEYPARLNEYVFFNIAAKTYLVHDGCGPVLEFRNDSIVRINDNYLHRNQFGAVKFVYNNEIYFFGGYGLFTTKNILTKYHFKTKDWIQIQMHGEKAQEPREAAYSFKRGNNLVVFGGENKDDNNVPNSKLLDNIVWRLHLPTMRWYCEGTYNQNLIKIVPDAVNHDSSKFYFKGDYFTEIDFSTNKIFNYDCIYLTRLLNSYLEGNTIIGVFGDGSKKYLDIRDIQGFKGKLRSTAIFISPINENHNYLKYVLLSLIVLLLLLIAFKNKVIAVVKPFKGIIYSKQKESLLHKGKPILLEKQEEKLLLYLLDNLNQFVSLNEINQLFEINGNTETISAIVKRREQAVSGLLTKVSKITGIEEQKLIIERKNSEDKRIKDILLLPNILKIES